MSQVNDKFPAIRKINLISFVNTVVLCRSQIFHFFKLASIAVLPRMPRSGETFVFICVLENSQDQLMKEQKVKYQSIPFLIKYLNSNRDLKGSKALIFVGLIGYFTIHSIFSELRWTSKFPLQQLNYKKYISLPGTNVYLSKVMSDKAIPRTEPLTIAWINDNYDKYHHFMESTTRNCNIRKRSIASQISCKKYFSSKNNAGHREYYFIKSRDFYQLEEDFTWEELDYEYDYGNYNEKIVTWEEASAMCGLLGGHLPWFGSRDSLTEILALLKLTQDTLVLEAIYIGLRFFDNEVSEDCLLS